MDFIWFLFAVLLTAVVYLRLSRKIGHLNLELSEDLKNEIITLIAEFNQSAERNITLMEDRIHVAKAISGEITEKLSYMKKLKDTLEKEIKETELKLKNILTNEKAVAKPPADKEKNVISKTYEQVKINTIPTQKTTPSDEIVEITKETLPTPDEGKQTPPPQEEPLKIQDEPTLTEKIILLARSGSTIPEIIQKLQISRGEVELVLKFSGYHALLDT
ncbi:MAG: hypothetical protein CVV50_05840 [Spirochaetae bacterium HGW-Spirochaetae-6]|jgi:hypothetical protein|nr:MAG: hypothetical protein CVV50_05840 [Spirochaetae bacterium HGW-Spirochaetae-6]